MTISRSYAAFAGDRLVQRGPLAEVLAAIKLGWPDEEHPDLLILENETGRQVDFDLRGSLADVLARVATREAPNARGRPRLGVESREVTLLPRHWAWLASQSGGTSAALRRLVEAASKRAEKGDGARAQRDAAYQAMAALAGDRPRFEEATRALFANEPKRFNELIGKWPKDVRAHLAWLVGFRASGRQGVRG